LRIKIFDLFLTFTCSSAFCSKSINFNFDEAFFVRRLKQPLTNWRSKLMPLRERKKW